jgi:hypothetical protein
MRTLFLGLLLSLSIACSSWTSTIVEGEDGNSYLVIEKEIVTHFSLMNIDTKEITDKPMFIRVRNKRIFDNGTYWYNGNIMNEMTNPVYVNFKKDEK